MIRVAFVLAGSDRAWLGGINYFRNLLGAISNLADRQIDPVILTGSRASQAMLTGLPAFEHHGLRLFDRFSPQWMLRKLLQDGSGRDPVLERALLAHKIKVLSHFGHLGKAALIPTLAWIPDFQHRRLPELFSSNERKARDRINLKICRYATRILVSSHAARRDLVDFHDEAAKKSRVLQFVASVPAPSELPSRDVLAKKYGCLDPYLLLPNQFWAHKNHKVVIEALAILKARGRAVTVLATGNPHDNRQPEHYAGLMALVRDNGLEIMFRVLGIIPYGDLMGLMSHARAIMNPSRFEGWSTTVEEAKSMGKKVILSDIDVHREQHPPKGEYFDPDDPAALADLMYQAWCDNDDTQQLTLTAIARAELRSRRDAFARNFESIVLECLRNVDPS